MKKHVLLNFLLVVSIFFLIIFIWQKNNQIKFLSPLAEKQVFEQKKDLINSTEIIGFLPSWTLAKKAKIFPQYLTQLIYFGIDIDKQGNLLKLDENGVSTSEWKYFNSDDFLKLKEEVQNNNNKVLVSIKCFDNQIMDIVLNDPTLRTKLIDQVNNLVIDYHLDGVNIDFEYLPDSNSSISSSFNLFFQELKSTLKKQNSDLIISVDLYVYAIVHNYPFDLEKIVNEVDQIILMAYDFHRPSSTNAGPIAPLRAEKNEYSIINALKSALTKINKEKIILGVPFYGYEWQTINEEFKSQTLPKSGALATYQRIKEILKNQDIKVLWNDQSMSPWFFYQQENKIKQIYYENKRSLKYKMELVKQLKLAGISIWALGYEGNSPEIWNALLN